MADIKIFNGATLRIDAKTKKLTIELKDGNCVRLPTSMGSKEHELWYGFVCDGQEYDLNVWDESVCEVPDGARYSACVYPVYGGQTDTCTMETLAVRED